MCGRYYLKVNIDELLERYGILKNEIKSVKEREIFPSWQVPIIIYQERPETETGPLGFPGPLSKEADYQRPG